MLDGIRVLDLSDARGWLCGQILADLGADVFQAPTGDPLDLAWQAYTRNKHVLDAVPTPERVAGVAARFDVVIDSGGRVDAAMLMARHPGLTVVSILPFGLTGPKAGYAATDLTVGAAAGFLYLTGERDRAPLRISEPQAFLHACVDAAAAVLVALRGGGGQHVDVSAQQSLTFALLARSMDRGANQPAATRAGPTAGRAGQRIQTRYRCADGWVLVSPPVVATLAAFGRRLMDWAIEDGHAGAHWRDFEWGTVLRRLSDGENLEAAFDEYHAAIAALVGARTKAEIMDVATGRRLLIAPVFTVAELAASEQLRSRSFAVDAPGGGRLPGAFARFSATPLRLERVAAGPPVPLDAVLTDGGGEPLGVGHEGTGRTAPLAGVKVLDLFWVVAGPTSTELLADYGATVVHVESRARQDTYRHVPPFVGGRPDPEGAIGFQGANANKLLITLDLSSEDGRAVVEDLIRWADVVTESFAPGVMQRMGLGYERVRELNPAVIMISSCLLGQTGPWSGYSGFGNLAAAVSGFYELVGYPDEPPIGCYGPYTDFVASRYNSIAILAALRHRERTGVGQHIDLSQAEASCSFLGPELLRASRTGEVAPTIGNRDATMCPHEVYRTAGDDRWIAIAVTDDAMWGRLVDLVGDPSLDAAWGGAERLRRRDAIDAALSAWVRDADGATLEASLQARGVAAHGLLDTYDLWDDPQLRHRGHFVDVPHPVHGNVTLEGPRFILSDAPARRPARAPTFGCDNARVLGELLGYDAERIAALDAGGALT